MATDVDICNLGLGFIGDAAEVSSVSPSDGSLQADHCQKFYPIARKAFMVEHEWSFATRRVDLASLGTPNTGFLYRYSEPNLVLKPMRVVLAGEEKETDFTREVDFATNKKIINSSISPAELIYVFDQVNTLFYNPSAVIAIAYMTASFLVGPMKSGDQKMIDGLLKAYDYWWRKAAADDANAEKRGGSDDNIETYTSGGMKARGY